MKRVMDVIHNALFGVAWDRRGGVATFLAATIIPLVAFTGLAVDTARGYLMKSRLNYALDAAALAGGREMADEVKRDATIEKFFKANFPDGYMGATIDGPIIDADPVEKTIQLTATANMATSLMRVLGIQTMEVAASTEVKLSSRNIEVAVVLDITGSMVNPNPQKIVDLKAAATDLVDIVVQDSQTPHYSKVTLVPYSMGVNVGPYADLIRGPISVVNITGATKTNPVVVTAPSHGLADGNKILITDVVGMTQINNLSTGVEYTVNNPTADTFELRNASDSGNINGTTYSDYVSGGTVGRMCTVAGCAYLKFDADSGSDRIHRISSCVTERTGAEAYTDVAPSTAYVGRNYPNYPYSYTIPTVANRHLCLSNQIVPLTSDKTFLATEIDNFVAAGSTAGHIGIAWGWYMLSPNFAYIWPDADQKPADYDAPEMLKVAVIMTDGEFNTIYNNGVIAQNSGSNSGSANYKINANGTNGASSLAQAELLCAAMKAEPNKIEIYTIGFDVGGSAAVQQTLSNCATDAAHYYLAADGDELKTVFKTIAMNISRLRLSK